MSENLAFKKKKLREEIWIKMEKAGLTIFPKPCFGRIPNFLNVDKAAAKLKMLPEYKEAKVVLVNPDAAQAPVREMVLRNGKTLVMPTPKLKKGFLIINPDQTKGKERFASTIKGAFKLGKITEKIPKIDFIVEGCVAVDRKGNRLGKGGGYGDKEIKLAKQLSNHSIKVAVTCHSIQVVAEVPVNEYDEKVDYIATEKELIKVERD
ncbi:5-formyltetrahydrofolate cyclo-ligase [Candidatus Bathyarchaeota archaeon]|nr:5-formyltetrahydrofolate cyclo-ligase [Candidatus Bathyarchaeota archaeon]